MNPLRRYPVLSSLLSPFRRSQQKTCARPSRRTLPGRAGFELRHRRATRLPHRRATRQRPHPPLPLPAQPALRRLAPHRADAAPAGREARPVAAGAGLDLLAGQLQRADGLGLRRHALIPVAVSACAARNLARSQNLFEETSLRLCVDRLRAARVSAVWLCDRGFNRVGWLRRLVELEQHFVVRIKRDVTVRLPGGAYLLKGLEVGEGERRDFGFVLLRQDGAVRVRLIGVWAKGAKEVWWLATDLEQAVSKVVAYYDRRMGIEEQFRDAKGVRFGIKLRWTRFTRPEFVERMYLLVGVALLLWTTVGRAVEEAEPRVRLKSKRKGARLSLARIGSYYWLKMSRQLRLTARFVREHLPPPRLRVFKWLTAPQK
jgi:hypothetical protein